MRLALHILQGVLTIALLYPFCAPARQRNLRQRWSRRLLRTVGVEVRIEGAAVAPGALLVANHISWLDIYAINSLTPSAFVSKAEVRDWPVIGWLAARSETVFLRRGSRGHARIINGEIAALLDAGRNVAIFPEGTTSDGNRVLPFHAALLQAAVESAHPVQPVAVSYHDADGRRTTAAAYDGELSLGACLGNIVSHRRLQVRIRVGAAIDTAGADRKTVCRDARAAIVALCGLTEAGTEMERKTGAAAMPATPAAAQEAVQVR
ncbi:lysophospholipid acyltransferase family protein [Azoarcus olearius]|uniref:1-acyl-sn-glycerol-3-phosphate acyltransferase n=1 Tax=Azoarcus sp. (strain BH72) TaxID=418699 RepID=A1K3R6_AZOSB|nr:lysophospholipid acyltransferase family protein [Azoarcus olearius]CAL93471.1 putative 1-acyl-sn-glycerol-3-phosphate acyltransferase [Azoarcus olearius]